MDDSRLSLGDLKVGHVLGSSCLQLGSGPLNMKSSSLGGQSPSQAGVAPWGLVPPGVWCLPFSQVIPLKVAQQVSSLHHMGPTIDLGNGETSAYHEPGEAEQRHWRAHGCFQEPTVGASKATLASGGTTRHREQKGYDDRNGQVAPSSG